MMQSLNTSVSSNVTSTPESVGCREENEEEASHPVCSLRKGARQIVGQEESKAKGPFRHAEKKSKTKSGGREEFSKLAIHGEVDRVVSADVPP